jgi:hypothetical protein
MHVCFLKMMFVSKKLRRFSKFKTTGTMTIVLVETLKFFRIEVKQMVYQHINQYLFKHQKDPVKVAIICQKIFEHRATQNEITTIQQLFQNIYRYLRDDLKLGLELTVVALNPYDLRDYFLIQSYYYHVI